MFYFSYFNRIVRARMDRYSLKQSTDMCHYEHYMVMYYFSCRIRDSIRNEYCKRTRGFTKCVNTHIRIYVYVCEIDVCKIVFLELSLVIKLLLIYSTFLCILHNYKKRQIFL